MCEKVCVRFAVKSYYFNALPGATIHANMAIVRGHSRELSPANVILVGQVTIVQLTVVVIITAPAYFRVLGHVIFVKIGLLVLIVNSVVEEVSAMPRHL